MHTTNLRKVGDLIMLDIPPAILDVLQLRAGATVGLAVEQGHLVVEPTIRSRHSLNDLLVQCDPSAEITPEDRAWINNKSDGGELL